LPPGQVTPGLLSVAGLSIQGKGAKTVYELGAIASDVAVAAFVRGVFVEIKIKPSKSPTVVIFFIEKFIFFIFIY
jgi:hypothetical protein